MTTYEDFCRIRNAKESAEAMGFDVVHSLGALHLRARNGNLLGLSAGEEICWADRYEMLEQFALGMMFAYNRLTISRA